MIRTVLFASAIALAAPAIAQEAPATPEAAPPTSTEAPAESAPMTGPQSAPQSAPSADTTAAPGAQAAQPASGPAQVAQVIETDFPAFDKDSNGELNQTEFSDWMLKLRTASGDTTSPNELKTWANAAFAQADTDKSKTVNKAELTKFLAG